MEIRGDWKTAEKFVSRTWKAVHKWGLLVATWTHRIVEVVMNFRRKIVCFALCAMFMRGGSHALAVTRIRFGICVRSANGMPTSATQLEEDTDRRISWSKSECDFFGIQNISACCFAPQYAIFHLAFGYIVHTRSLVRTHTLSLTHGFVCRSN